MLGTHSWEKCVNIRILGVSDVETYKTNNQSLAYEHTSCVLFWVFYEEMIDNNINSRPTRLPSDKTGRNALSVSFSKLAASHLFQTCKKEDYIMVYAMSVIIKAGA